MRVGDIVYYERHCKIKKGKIINIDIRGKYCFYDILYLKIEDEKYIDRKVKCYEIWKTLEQLVMEKITQLNHATYEEDF